MYVRGAIAHSCVPCWPKGQVGGKRVAVYQQLAMDVNRDEREAG
jgi:hypothetical protein